MALYISTLDKPTIEFFYNGFKNDHLLIHLLDFIGPIYHLIRLPILVGRDNWSQDFVILTSFTKLLNIMRKNAVNFPSSGGFRKNDFNVEIFI